MKATSLKKSFLVYILSNLLSTGLPFALLPFLTDHLSKSDYGVLSNFTGLLSLAMPLIGINFVSAYTRQYFKKDVDIKDYVGTGLSLQLLLAVFIGSLFLIFQDFIVLKTGVDPQYVNMAAIYCFIFSVSEIVLTNWRIEDRVWFFGLFRIGRTFVEVTLTLYFVVNLNMDYHGRVLAILSAVLITFIPVLVILFRKGYLKFSWNKNYLRHIVSYGVPLIPHAFAGAILVYSDKLIITSRIGLDANGVYSVAFQVGLIIALIQNSFNLAWVPWFYKQLTSIDPGKKNKIVKITYLYYLGLLIATILLIVLTPYIFMILGKEFNGGIELVGWVAVGFLFNGMYKMKVNYLFFIEKTSIIAAITIFTAGINIGLNYALIDIYGVEGAAIATSITFLIQLILGWIISNRYYPMPWFNRN